MAKGCSSFMNIQFEMLGPLSLAFLTDCDANLLHGGYPSTLYHEA